MFIYEYHKLIHWKLRSLSISLYPNSCIYEAFYLLYRQSSPDINEENWLHFPQCDAKMIFSDCQFHITLYFRMLHLVAKTTVLSQ